METAPIKVKRWRQRFEPDDRRVIARYFNLTEVTRMRAVVERVLRMDEAQVDRELKRVTRDFAHRHVRLADVWEDHFEEVAQRVIIPPDISRNRRHLIGAYFTLEYSIEAAALFNPSIVPNHDQSGLPGGALRFLMSLRATGEGHVSSIVFRTGIIYADGTLQFDLASPFARSLKPLRDMRYDKETFFYKVIEIGAYNQLAGDILDRLPDAFNYTQLEEATKDIRQDHTLPGEQHKTVADMLWLARSNYVLELSPDSNPSEVVIFPTTENQRKGIEDMRLVRFTEDDGSVCYYGTFTAYDGVNILPQLMETRDFQRINIMNLSGRFAMNKGHALFPRRIKGWYVMSGRVDGENLYIMRSKNVHFWNDAEMVQMPKQPWELVQIGNCGSPLETEHGWLLLTHGVGPMRRYCIGASLLDLENPCRVIGHLKKPLLAPVEKERDGYVPNVVYSCGALLHNDTLIIPYAMADSATSCASVSVSELIDHLRKG